MMNATNNIAVDLFYKIRSRFSGLKLGTAEGTITINPEEARFFDFDYKDGEKNIGHVSISLAEENSMKVYFSAGITESMDTPQKKGWYGFLKELRGFAKRRLMAFDTRDIAKDNLDKRDYAFLSQNAQPKQPQPNMIQKPVGESIMSESAMYGSRTMSYQKLMDTRLIIKHNKAVMDDTQPGARARNISALFVENQDGERFKYPFIHLAGARAMQRHVANGGLPYDDIGKSIVKMSEEIAQLRSFSAYVVRNDLMNSETNGIVEQSAAALNKLREQVAKLAKQSHYEAYKESFQAINPVEVPQDVVEDFTDKFTVKNFKEDIKSVFPILYRLMQENNKVDYDDIVAMTTESVNDEAEVDLEEEKVDEFANFENWIMNLGEESAISSSDPEEKSAAVRELQELVGQHFPAGVNGDNAIPALKGIIEDPELFKTIKEQGKQDPDSCVRGLVKDWLEANAPDVLEELDFGDFVEEPEAAAQEDFQMNEGSGMSLEYETDAANVEFERGPDGSPKVTRVLIGKVDITPTLDPQVLEDLASEIDNDYTSPSQGHMLNLELEVDYSMSGSYRPATWGYHGGEPAEYPEIDDASVYVVGNGKKVEISSDDLGKGASDWIDEKIYADAEEGSDDYDDYDRYEDTENGESKVTELSADKLDKYKKAAQSSADAVAAPGGSIDGYDMERYWKRKKGIEKANKKIDAKQGKLNFEGKNSKVQELAEFIKSFYDKESGTFPKGPEGVCTMVGKKFGEQAEQVARKFVERMAPQQTTDNNPELQELARIKKLSGISQGIGM